MALARVLETPNKAAAISLCFEPPAQTEEAGDEPEGITTHQVQWIEAIWGLPLH